MEFLWDIIFIAIIVVMTFLAYRKGLIKTVFNLLGTVVAFVGALVLREPVGQWIDTAFVKAPVRKMVLSTLSDTPILDYEQALAQMDVAGKIRSMPDALKDLLDMVGLPTDEILSNITAATDTIAKNDLIDSIASPISATISTAIAFVALFVVLLVVCFVAAKLLSALLGLLPIGKTLDRIGGGIVGLVEGALIVLVVSAVFWAVSMAVDNGFFSRAAMEDTVFTAWLIEHNPICSLF